MGRLFFVEYDQIPSDKYMHCGMCRTRVAFIEDHIAAGPNIRAGIFNKVHKLSFWNDVPLLNFNEEQLGGANDQQVPNQDLGANVQNDDQNGRANDQIVPNQDVGASDQIVPNLDGAANNQQVPNLDAGANDQQVPNLNGGANDRQVPNLDAGDNVQNDDEDGGANDQQVPNTDVDMAEGMDNIDPDN